MNISKRTKLQRVSNAVAAGTTTITSSAVDTKGFRGCRFIVPFGAIVSTGVQSVEIHQATTSTGTYAAMAGTNVALADTDDNKIVNIDIRSPREQFLKCVVNRATANSTVDGIFAELYDPAIVPTTDDATTVIGSELHVAPAEGAA